MLAHFSITCNIGLPVSRWPACMTARHKGEPFGSIITCSISLRNKQCPTCITCWPVQCPIASSASPPTQLSWCESTVSGISEDNWRHVHNIRSGITWYIYLDKFNSTNALMHCRCDIWNMNRDLLFCGMKNSRHFYSELLVEFKLAVRSIQRPNKTSCITTSNNPNNEAHCLRFWCKTRERIFKDTHNSRIHSCPVRRHTSSLCITHSFYSQLFFFIL